MPFSKSKKEKGDEKKSYPTQKMAPAYPTQPPPQAQGYPPQPQAQGYPPQPQAQGYPPQPQAQGYPPQPQAQGYPPQPQAQGYPPQGPPPAYSANPQPQVVAQGMPPQGAGVGGQYGRPAQPAMYYPPQPNQPTGTVVMQGGFEAGARFSGNAPPTIPPPPPGIAPNAAQHAVSTGQNVVISQKKGSWMSGGGEGGYSVF